MKITDIDSFIEEFRNGRDIFSRTSIELSVREIEKQRKRIAELEQERRWISIDERLPNSSERVLIRMSNYYTVIASFFRNQKYWKNDAGAIVHNVTHWQPLPQPQKEGE